MKRKLILVLLVILTGLTFAFYRQEQNYITYQGCKLCDGNQYLGMYNYFEGINSEYIAKFPYYSRALVPFLASFFFENDPYSGFQFINLLFSILAVISLFFVWEKLQLPWYLSALGFFWLLFHWTGLIRLNAFDPITIDVPIYLVHALLILIFLSRKFNWLYILGPLAVIQKESIIVLLMVLLVYSYLYNRLYKEDKLPLLTIAIALGLSVLTKFIFTLVFPPSEPGYSSIRLVLFYIREVLIDPFRLVRWITGVLTAYGAILMVSLFKIRRENIEDRNLSFLTIMSAISILLSILGGQDSTRIAFLGFPFVMTWILLLVRECDWRMIGAALFFSLPLMRIFEKIPDPGKDFSTFALWYPEFAPASLVTGLAGYFALVLLILVGLLILSNKKE
jgi:hypothetical protein